MCDCVDMHTLHGRRIFHIRWINELTLHGDVIKRTNLDLKERLETTDIISLITPLTRYSKDYLFLKDKKRNTIFIPNASFFGGANILTLLGGKCLVQKMFIWSHTAYRRTYFIVFICYNVIHASFFAFVLTLCTLAFTFTIAWVFFAHFTTWMLGCFSTAVNCFKRLSSLNVLNWTTMSTVASPAFTRALWFLF